MSTQVAERHQHATIAPSTVEGVLNFAERTPEKAYTYTFKPPEGVPGTNIKPYGQKVELLNAREIAKTLDVDVQSW